ncbi:uncharacterized protein LOC114755315 isoform X2 [Neltuma alba]|uniref:uncharacterized protein LOC114755315 isoform X2 n=1 Tax=Neltuma alba TaxID=207710 RepID=UPI0010A566CB|nr:uncharacterized protein LOC114755315 isoform X2 [Prosopis alba]
MQVFSNARRFSRALLNSYHFLSYDLQSVGGPHLVTPCRNTSSLSSKATWFLGSAQSLTTESVPVHLLTSKSFSTSITNTDEGASTEAVKELYDKMLESVNVKRSMPPNAWLWSMIEKCGNHGDIELLFDILQNLRRFRLSNLRIHTNFNDNLCREVSKACARVGALDFGKKTLWKHNVYGLTPSVASAHHLLTYAKNHNDSKLLVEVMKLIKANDLPLQPGTADIVFSICYKTDNWELINKYAKRFVGAGVKLRQTSFDTWMEFAARRGDTESLWKIERLRSESMKQHTLASGLSCAKGLLLEHKPNEAATVIQALNETLPDAKKSGMKDELQKLVSEWPLEVIKHQKEEGRKALAASLKSDILAMVDLLSMGLEASINLEDLNRKDGILL